MKVVAFVPIKSESQRLPHKNTREFAGQMGGLSYVKLKQLIQSKLIDEIVVSTDDYWLIDFVLARLPGDKITIYERPKEYSDRDLPTHLLHEHAAKCLRELKYQDDDVVMWAQVTNPLFGFEEYNAALLRYFSLDHLVHDSLQTATPMKGFFRSEDGFRALNWDKKALGNWPRSQTMEKVLSVDSATSIIRLRHFERIGDRVGFNPYFYHTPGLMGWDIDTLQDFQVAELLYKSGIELG